MNWCVGEDTGEMREGILERGALWGKSKDLCKGVSEEGLMLGKG